LIIVTSSFSKSSVLKMFTVHTKTRSRCFQIPPFRKLRFHDGLGWTVGLTVGIKLHFQISSAAVETCVGWKTDSQFTKKKCFKGEISLKPCVDLRANLIRPKRAQVISSQRKCTQGLTKTESQVDPSFQLAFTCESVRPGRKRANPLYGIQSSRGYSDYHARCVHCLLKEESARKC